VLESRGVVRYAIYRDDLDFFVHLESTEPKTPSESVDPVVRRWWGMMGGYMVTTPDTSPGTWPLEEVFWMGMAGSEGPA
jgi:L-rhamnose mutarotase